MPVVDAGTVTRAPTGRTIIPETLDGEIRAEPPSLKPITAVARATLTCTGPGRRTRYTLKVSSVSGNTSLIVETVKVLLVSPGANVRKLIVLLKSLPAIAVPDSVR